MRRLRDKLHMLDGTGPYAGDMSNICYGDGYFAKSIEQDFGMPMEKLRELVERGDQ